MERSDTESKRLRRTLAAPLIGTCSLLLTLFVGLSSSGSSAAAATRFPGLASARTSASAGTSPRPGAPKPLSAASMAHLLALAPKGKSTKTLVYGDGDGGDTEPLTNLQSILQSDGQQVVLDESDSLPPSLKGIGVIWYVSLDPISSADETTLENFVSSGHGLYLTGERPCCEALNGSDASILNDLLTNGNVQVEIGRAHV